MLKRFIVSTTENSENSPPLGKIPNKVSAEEKKNFNAQIQKICHRTRIEGDRRREYAKKKGPWWAQRLGPVSANEEEANAVREAIAAVSRKSGWKRKEEVDRKPSFFRGEFLEQLKLQRGNQHATIGVTLNEDTQEVTVAILEKFNLNDPESINKIHRMLKGKKKVNNSI